ncbi:hypothetical protein Y032_0281g1240 [Ancylostoma ceylanicum]|nr:hypothetical protein Y032_0281g1240 [Ancylostoma ceylanicum]
MIAMEGFRVVKDRFKLTQALVVDPLYLQHSWMDKSIDYRHWGIPLSRRFRSLKLWFVIRCYGVEGLQNYIREHVRLAKKMEALLRADQVFEIVGEVIMGLVCFRMRGNDERNQQLLTRLNSSGRIHMHSSHGTRQNFGILPEIVFGNSAEPDFRNFQGKIYVYFPGEIGTYFGEKQAARKHTYSARILSSEP